MMKIMFKICKEHQPNQAGKYRSKGRPSYAFSHPANAEPQQTDTYQIS